MSTLRFAEITESLEASLSLRHLQSFLNSKAIEVETVLFKSDELSALMSDSKRLNALSVLKVTCEQSQVLLKKWKAWPTQVRHLECCDIFLNEKRVLWPRVLLYDSLRESIVENFREHDIKEAGYVICNDLRGRILISLLLGLGHRKVYLVGDEPSFIQAEVDLLRRHHIGTEILSLPIHQLTLQTTRASILINAIDLTTHKHVLSNLAYFNFMKKEGLVLDLDFLRYQSPLLEEASKADLKSLSIEKLSAHYDFSLIQKLGLQDSFRFEEYLQSWSKFLSENGSKTLP